MFSDPRKAAMNMEEFAPGVSQRRALYGLPSSVNYCQSCVISNQRPNSAIEFKHQIETKKETILFHEDGRCDACLANDVKNQIDWKKRDILLRRLCDRHRKHDGSYDCLVPGSGGKDSFYQAHVLKYQYGMNPLTVTWAPHLYTEWGRRNHQRWIDAGFDNYLMTPNSRVHRLLTRIAVEKLFHPFQPFMIGQKLLAPKMANLFNIPLIFYGENEAEYGNSSSDNNQSQRSNRYFAADGTTDLLISGTTIKNIIDDFGLTQNDLEPYLPISMRDLNKKAIEVHYLGYFLKWHPQSAYYYACEHGNFEASPERTPGTYSKYNSIDDKIDDFHYYTTFVKFGIGRASYDASQEIRSGDISREEGVALVKKFDGEYPDRFESEIFDYLSISASEFPKAHTLFEKANMDREYFDALTNKFRSPHLWQQLDNNWFLRSRVK
jgi:N-acetyl sugar amidotransferase